MKRIISAKNYSSFVRVTYFEDYEIKIFEDIVIEQNYKYEKLEKAIESFVEKHNIKYYKLSFNMDDNECITKLFNINKTKIEDCITNMRYQFSDLIDEDNIDDYIFDYQIVGVNNSMTDICFVAAKKETIEEYIKIGVNLGKRVELLRPEHSSIGNVLSKKSDDGIIVVDMCFDETIVRIFEGKRLVATNISREGSKECIDILNENTYQKTNEFKKQLAKLSSMIVKTISYYDEKRISKSDYKVMLIGEGAMLPQVKKTLESICSHKFVSPNNYISGRCNSKEAALLFTDYGLLL